MKWQWTIYGWFSSGGFVPYQLHPSDHFLQDSELQSKPKWCHPVLQFLDKHVCFCSNWEFKKSGSSECLPCKAPWMTFLSISVLRKPTWKQIWCYLYCSRNEVFEINIYLKCMHLSRHCIDANGRKLNRGLQKYKPSLDGSKNIQGTPPPPTPLLPSSSNLDFCSTDVSLVKATFHYSGADSWAMYEKFLLIRIRKICTNISGNRRPSRPY